MKITTPEIICDVFSFLHKSQIQRVQLVNQFWNSVIIRHKNIWTLRQFVLLDFIYNQIDLYATEQDEIKRGSYKIKFDGINLSKVEENVSSWYQAKKLTSQLTVDEVLTNLNDVVFDSIRIRDILEGSLDDLVNLIKLVTTKTGGRFRGRFGHCDATILDSRLVEIFDNYIIVDELALFGVNDDSYIREFCANPAIVQLPSTPKEIRLQSLEFKENDEVLNFTCNGKLNGANRVTIDFKTSKTNYGNFIRQWFEAMSFKRLYRTHENPISLVGKFELGFHCSDVNRVLDAVKTFLNNTQLRVKYSLETKDFFHSIYYCVIDQYVKRSYVLHETDSYALVIEMEYDVETDMSSIDASDLDQPPCDQMFRISFCVKLL